MSEKVNHPNHYNNHPAGIECIDVVEHFGFNTGNVIKYVWRCEFKGSHLEDLHKAKWYLEREIERISNGESADEGQPEPPEGHPLEYVKEGAIRRK